MDDKRIYELFAKACEGDLAWEENFRVLPFARAIEREALEEAAKVCENVAKYYVPRKEYALGSLECAKDIRALLSPEGGK